jgi:hypothetical protein
MDAARVERCGGDVCSSSVAQVAVVTPGLLFAQAMEQLIDSGHNARDYSWLTDALDQLRTARRVLSNRWACRMALHLAAPAPAPALACRMLHAAQPPISPTHCGMVSESTAHGASSMESLYDCQDVPTLHL